MIETEVGLNQTIELMAGQYRALAALHREVAPLSVANYRVLAEGPLEEIRRFQTDIADYLQIPTPRTLQDFKALAVVQIARDRFSQCPDWITFFHEVLGVDGIARRLFSTPGELAEFERSASYAEVQSMLAGLQASSGSPTTAATAPTGHVPSNPSPDAAHGKV
jgi:hypothetical protein